MGTILTIMAIILVAILIPELIGLIMLCAASIIGLLLSLTVSIVTATTIIAKALADFISTRYPRRKKGD